jgi:subtilisin family serine protease
MRSILVSTLVLAMLGANGNGQEGPVGQPPPPTRPKAGTILRDRALVKLTRVPALPNDGKSGAIGVADFDRLAASLGVTRVKPVFKRPSRGRRDPAAAAAIGLDRWVRVEFGRDRDDLEQALVRLRALKSVEIAETDRRVLPAVVPDDTDYAGSQWDLQPAFTDAEGAWDLDTDSSERVIFVIDTGVEVTHSDIAANLWVNPGEIAGNGIDDDGNGFIDDVNGWNFRDDTNDVGDQWPHGMHVNGIIGAVGNNTHDVAGINWKCQLAQGRIFNAVDGTWEAGAAATTYAADNGAVCTNNSWGDTVQGPQVFVDAMLYADGLDVLQVAAAGNQGDTNQFWPAAYAEFTSVAATNSSDTLAWFSSHGDWIDMAAPGESIFNLWVGDSEASLSGTSMASPHVAGAGALLRSLNPQLTNHEARVTLRLFSDDLGTSGYDTDFGFGRLDIHKAFDAAHAISLSTRSPTRPGSVDVTMDAPGEANMVHVLLASMSGITPGLDLLGVDPAEFRIFPLNFDFLMEFELANPTNGVTYGFIDYLDAAGHDVATFNVIGGKFFKDQTISVCYCTLDPNDLSHVRFISAPLSFDVH